MKLKGYKYLYLFAICLISGFNTLAQNNQKCLIPDKDIKEIEEAVSKLKLLEKLHKPDLNYLNQRLEILPVPLPPEPPQPDPEPGSNQPEGKAYAEKTRVISKNFNIDGNDKLSLNNQYGNIQVNTWSKNEIKVQIEIKAFERSEENAEDLLNDVEISDSRQGNTIYFVTEIERQNNGWWGIRKSNGREERRGVQVNYTVYMPGKNALDISNKYGAINLPDFAGLLSIRSSYGSFKADRLTNPGNHIKVSYGSANIESLSSGNLEVSYGSLNLGRADKIDAEVNYSSAKIGKLSGDGDLNLKYCGGFKISEIEPQVKNLNVNAAYSSVSLGFDPAANFAFDVTVSYCGFRYEDGKVSVTKTSPENERGFQPTKNYKGQVGKRGDAKVTVNSKYGSVQFL